MLGLRRVTTEFSAYTILKANPVFRPLPSHITQLRRAHTVTAAAAYDSYYSPTTNAAPELPAPPTLSQPWGDTMTLAAAQKAYRQIDLQRRLLQQDVRQIKHRVFLTPTPQQHDHPLYWQDDHLLYWQQVPQWRDVTKTQFISYQWTLKNSVKSDKDLFTFLRAALPETLKPSEDPALKHIRTKDDFIGDALCGLKKAPMNIRLMPHVLSVIDWSSPLDDPVRRQFIPLSSGYLEDHPELSLDSLHEEEDSVVPGLVHRYPDKALFLATSICPVYCRYCTRSYAIGGDTDTVSKTPQSPSRERWELVFQHIEKTPVLNDIVVSGGDTYYLSPDNIMEIGNRLLSIPHIKRIRFATKGLAVAPGRILDPGDEWTMAIIAISNQGRTLGKHVCIHTHFNHPNEITWTTKQAAQKLFQNNVIVRNQSVLLKGVNDSIDVMGKLIRDLADINYQPYYVYQCDLVQGIEDLRTPLSTILDIEQRLRGTIAGFMMPDFVVDLPEGGGKRLATSYDKYDRTTGVSTFKAPGLLGEKGQRVYKYYDPHSKDEHWLARIIGALRRTGRARCN